MRVPSDFIEYLKATMRDGVVERLVSGLEQEPSVSIRLNPAFGLHPEIPGAEPVPWCDGGWYLDERPVFTADPLFHAGAYYVQEASSMFIDHVVRTLAAITDRPFRRCLDLCAAPGGKTTLLRSVVPPDCLLISNEPIRARAQVLAENVAKWGQPNMLVSQAYPADFAPFVNTFDLILADVPCSGEGMMRKEAEAVAQWSKSLVADCAARQRIIISDIWPTLRPGGFLIYSTCTFNHEEDEDNVEWIARELGGEVIAIPTKSEWNIDGDLRSEDSTHSAGSLPCCHFLPGTARGEGFFCAAIRKKGNEDSVIINNEDSIIINNVREASRSKKDKRSRGELKLTDRLNLLPTDQLDSPDSPSVEFSLEDAFRYLRGESLVLEPSVPRGIVQVCYRGRRLGLMKNIGNRANNLYPKAWRIHSTHIQPKTILG